MTATKVVQGICIGRAGEEAARRAIRADASGFRRLLSESAVTAYHEAGHATVASLAFDWTVSLATIVPEFGSDGRKVSCGHTLQGSKDATSIAPREHYEMRVMSDWQRVARMAYLAAEPMTWQGALRIIRVLRIETARLVDLHWPEITSLANKLQRCQSLDTASIESVLKGRYHLRRFAA